MFSESEAESTFEVIVMDEGQNYTAFSSRGLLDMIGDLNDKALEASRMKDVGLLDASRMEDVGLLDASRRKDVGNREACRRKDVGLAEASRR